MFRYVLGGDVRLCEISEKSKMATTRHFLMVLHVLNESVRVSVRNHSSVTVHSIFFRVGIMFMYLLGMMHVFLKFQTNPRWPPHGIFWCFCVSLCVLNHSSVTVHSIIFWVGIMFRYVLAVMPDVLKFQQNSRWPPHSVFMMFLCLFVCPEPFLGNCL